MIKNIEFPSRPVLKESAYAPLYIEPLLESGERICIGTVVKFGAETRVVITDQVPRLSSLFGGPVLGLLFIIKCAAENLEQFLIENTFDEISQWSSQLGVFVGPVTYHPMPSLDVMVDVALMGHCLLYRYKDSSEINRH